MRRVSFHRLAERELNDTILEQPQAGAVVVGTIRRRLIRRFPYALLYSVRRSGGVRILAVMNLKRRPMYWVDRE